MHTVMSRQCAIDGRDEPTNKSRCSTKSKTAPTTAFLVSKALNVQEFHTVRYGAYFYQMGPLSSRGWPCFSTVRKFRTLQMVVASWPGGKGNRDDCFRRAHVTESSVFLLGSMNQQPFVAQICETKCFVEHFWCFLRNKVASFGGSAVNGNTPGGVFPQGCV